MAVLGKTDFIRDGSNYRSSGGKYAGKTRFEIVDLMIENNETFVEGKTSTGRKLKAIRRVSKTNVYPVILQVKSNTGKDIEEISITKIFKSPLFGGGGGSGGGAAVTAITESGQCYYCSLAFNVKKGPLKLSDITDANMEKASRYVQATVAYTAFKDRVPSDWIESGTFIKTANEIYKKYSSKVTGGVYFHRGSTFMGKVYAAKKEVIKIDKQMAQKDGRAPLAPGSFSDDKWNPGDIWMTTMTPGSDPLAMFKQDWGILNQAVLDKAGRLNTPRTFLLGISLKKLGSTVKLEEYNAPERVKLVSHPYKNYVFGKNNDFFSSIDMYMNMGSANVQFRAFNSSSSWQGEIKGLSAAGGKIGGGNLNFYCEKHIRKSIGSQGLLSGWKETPSSQVKLNDMYVLYKKYAKNPVDVKPFIKQCLDKGGSFIFSKNMCLLFLDTMMSATSTQRNNVCTDIIKYAASSTDLSSFFVKVS